MAKKIDTTNPEQLIYQNELLKLTVLGGVKLEGLDRMRVTLKIELKETNVPPVRHNLDLYNDTQTEKLIRKAAEKLETGTSVLAATLSELTEQLETYRLEKIKETAPQPYEPPKLTKEEHKKVVEFLESPDLLEKTNELIGKTGVVGEENNRLLMYLIFTSRKRNYPLHVVSLGASGTGKTHLQEGVSKLIPDEDKIEITTLSENAFYYFGQRELKNKLILIEDLDGAENSLYPLRELQSKKRISKTIAHKNTKGETRTIHLIVEGPVSVAGCTTQEQIYEDNANRSFLIYLDESQQQDTRIMEYQRAQSAGVINIKEEEEIQVFLQNCQRILEPVRVVNPYAKFLTIPQEVFKPRRTNSHYLQFIEVVTYYKQFQKERQYDKETGEAYIETTPDDIADANKLLAEVLLRKSDVITGACRNYFEKLKLYLIRNGEKQFTNRQISQKLRISIATIKRHHLQLFNAGYLKYEKDKQTKTYLYEIVSYEEYNQLNTHINEVLEKALSKLHACPELVEGLNGSTSDQSINEPLKEVSNNELAPKKPRTEKKVS